MTDSKIPVVTIVGRPNVGKSTLFNALTKTRRALVADKEGVTRDRREQRVRPLELENREICMVDTGGWMPESWRKQREDATILRGIETQIIQGLAHSSVVLLVVDLRAGVSPLDREIASFLRKQGKSFVLICNKFDDDNLLGQEYDFASLGATETILVSAEHRRGISELWGTIKSLLPMDSEAVVEEVAAEADLEAAKKNELPPLRICIVGRPNVGKSSLLNCILGEERVVESPIPGTTTDSVDIEIESNGRKIILIDTAGIRRHAKRADDVENLAVMYAKRNLEKVDLAFLVVDAADGITAQDAKIAQMVEDSGSACILIANKWDLAPEFVARSTEKTNTEFTEMVREEMPFLDYAPILGISAKEHEIYFQSAGVEGDQRSRMKRVHTIQELFDLGMGLLDARDRSVPTIELNERLQDALQAGPNIAQNVGQVHFAVQMKARTPVFCAYVRNPSNIPDSYRRFLSRTVRQNYGFRGNPIRWIFRRRGEIRKEAHVVSEYKKFQKNRKEVRGY